MEKIKQFIGSDKGRDVLIVLIIILVGTGSFGLGRLSKGSTNSSNGLKIEYSGIEPEGNQQNQANVVSAVKPSEKAFFASKRGSKYYPAGCPAGANLKPENRVYFSTNTAAEDAGYELSSSCK